MALEKTEDGEETNANWGFLDQQESIRWVRKHIDAFGGDREKIMIFGQSAGGVSTLLHLLYSGEMISSVVSHSNPLAIPMKENWEGQKQAWQFADTADCIKSTITSAEDRNACLRALSKDEVMSVKGKMPQLVNPDRLFTLAMKFLPMVDNSIMHRQPFWDLIDGIYDKNINIMAGSVEHETEIYVRSVWGKPISGAEAIAGVRAIVHVCISESKITLK
jgi:carboxylesterase type B